MRPFPSTFNPSLRVSLKKSLKVTSGQICSLHENHFHYNPVTTPVVFHKDVEILFKVNIRINNSYTTLRALPFVFPRGLFSTNRQPKTIDKSSTSVLNNEQWYIGNNEQKLTIDIASHISNCSVGSQGHNNATDSSVRKDTLAGHLPLLLQCSLVAPNCHGPMACHLHDQLLIKVHLVHFHGGHRVEGMISVMVRQASISPHAADNVP